VNESLQWEIGWPRRVRTAGDAVRFINAAGFCMLFPVKNVPLPSLYYAAARRYPATWDKYAEMLWEWKDNLPRQGRAFYAKYFRTRGTFISLAMLPNFLAMRGSAAAPGDPERLYAEGRISHDARTIWQALEEHGPLATLELRHTCRMESKAGNVRFKRAMLDLQCLLVVVHFGAEQETAAWPSGRFALTARAFPRQVALARRIAPAARAALASKYLQWHPDAPAAMLARLFGWPKPEAKAATAASGRSESKR
jgi:hypothetical protein